MENQKSVPIEEYNCWSIFEDQLADLLMNGLMERPDNELIITPKKPGRATGGAA